VKRCPLTYDLLSSDRLFAGGPSSSEIYSQRGLRQISARLTKLNILPFTAQQLQTEAMARAPKMSIQGVQPKLSARLNVKKSCFEIADSGGTYILKPPHALYVSLPENEDLTMRLAASINIETPLHGLLYASDGSLTYFIKRFDRFGRSKKRMQEDFAQLTGKTRDTKYDSSIEQVIGVINKYCTFPAVERLKLFRIIIFSFLIGNEDMHLKNFSLLSRDGLIGLSPAYDLLNTTLALPNAVEESALPLNGKKRKLNRSDFISYLGAERLELNSNLIDLELATIAAAQENWVDLISRSFLSQNLKDLYLKLIQERRMRLQI